MVYQLAASMDGRVDVVNTEPGAEFRVCFPVITGESC
jgi:signal transduction histidine kinase